MKSLTIVAASLRMCAGTAFAQTQGGGGGIPSTLLDLPSGHILASGVYNRLLHR